MASTASGPKPSAFLGLPLELRQQIYGYCIPENLRFDCSRDLYYQNRPQNWVEPPWHPDDPYYTTGQRRDWRESNYHSVQDFNDCRRCVRYEQNASFGGNSVWIDEKPELAWSDDEDERSERKDSPTNPPSTEQKADPFGLDNERDGVPKYVGSDWYQNTCQLCHHYLPDVPPSRRSALPGLLLVCRQVTDEVEAMLYGGNVFQVALHGSGESDLARLFSPETRRKMRKILLVLRPMGVSYTPGFRMDTNVWDCVLGNLKVLGIVAEQPMKDSSPFADEGRWSRAIDEWAAWLKPILAYLNQVVPKEVDTVADANKQEATVEMISTTLAERCRFQQFPSADLTFRRGQCSEESNYWGDSWDDGPTSCRDIIDDCDYDLYYDD